MTRKRKTHKRKTRRMHGGEFGFEGRKRRRSRRLHGIAGKRRRSRRLHGVGGKVSPVKAIVAGATAAAGAIAASFAAGALPKVNPKLKPLIPIAAGALLSSTKLGRNEMVKNAALGMIAIGAIAAIRQFAPKLPLLAGEEVYTPEEMAMLGYAPDADSEELLGMSASMAGLPASYSGVDSIGPDSI